MLAIKALFAVTVYLIKGFTNCHTAFFKLNMHQRQTIHQNGNVIAVGVIAGLLKLSDYLTFISINVFFV